MSESSLFNVAFKLFSGIFPLNKVTSVWRLTFFVIASSISFFCLEFNTSINLVFSNFFLSVAILFEGNALEVNSNILSGDLFMTP